VKKWIAAMGIWAASSVAAFSQEAAPHRTPRVVNVTLDSEKGWIPSEDLERQARKTANDFMADEDSGRAAEAYARFAEINRAHQPFPEFSASVHAFGAKSGAVVERRITTVTWTKNPAQAPLPGVYVALDLVSRFANVDRHCGYLVLYQAPSGGTFQIMREESNYLDNATAASIAKKSSAAAVEQAWATTSANCPGYRSAPSSQAAAVSAPLKEGPTPDIEYPNVTAALAGLHAKPGVVFKEQAGWIVVTEDAANTFWSFPPPGNPAYPAMVQRQLIEKDGAISMKMSVHCEASKQACDDLVRSFQELNAQVAAKMEGPR
jgi:hypothetical protein